MAGMISRALHSWKAASDEAKHSRLSLQRAQGHHAHHLLRLAWSAWAAYVKLSQRTVLLQRQSDWLRCNRLVADHYVRWRAAYSVRLVEIRKSHGALWVWSQNLQRRVSEFTTDVIMLLHLGAVSRRAILNLLLREMQIYTPLHI